jgi:hypothetical protein
VVQNLEGADAPEQTIAPEWAIVAEKPSGAHPRTIWGPSSDHLWAFRGTLSVVLANTDVYHHEMIISSNSVLVKVFLAIGVKFLRKYGGWNWKDMFGQG